MRLSNLKNESVQVHTHSLDAGSSKSNVVLFCKVRFRILHIFYDQLCPDCAPFNYDKRNQTADLTGTVAVVTGSRVKIGFQVCLKLLRAGATVVATTRFPNNAVAAYKHGYTSYPLFVSFGTRCFAAVTGEKALYLNFTLLQFFFNININFIHYITSFNVV